MSEGSPVLNDYTHTVVCAAIEQNNVDLFLLAADRGEKTILREEDFTGIIGKPWWPNYLVDPCFREDTLESRIRHIRSQIEEKKLPPVMKFGPKGKPENLRMHLLRNEFVAMAHNPPGMAMRLEDVNEDQTIVDDFRIDGVRDAKALRVWLSFYSVFEFEMFEVLIQSPSVRLYVGRINGKPVGASMMFFSSGVAGLYQVQVPQEYRRRGIGTAMTLEPMREARQAGYKIAVLQASKMGEPVYRKIGFKSYFEYSYCSPKGCSYADFIAA